MVIDCPYLFNNVINYDVMYGLYAQAQFVSSNLSDGLSQFSS